MPSEAPPDELTPKVESAEPSPAEISEYFKRLGLSLREYFRILKAPEFEVSGAKAKREGWFLGYHSIVEAAFVLKVAELANLSEQDASLLLQAAMLHEANKRDMYRPGADATTEGRFQSRLRGEEKLTTRGIDPRVLIIGRGAGSDFPLRFLGAVPKDGLESDAATFRLEGFLSYIHNSIETAISKDENAKKSQRTEIVSWQERLRLAKERHPEIAGEKTVIDGTEMTSFEIEAKSTAAVENELKRLINEIQPGTINDATPLSTLIRAELMKDIKNKKAIKLPAGGI